MDENLLKNSESSNYQESMVSLKATKLKDDMDDEIHSMYDN